MRTYKKAWGRMFRRPWKNTAPAAKLDMPETRRYIERLQRPDGRFSDADAKAEALALDALRTLGCEDGGKIYGRAKDYLLTLENRDWGFSSKPGRESSMEGTFHAVSALKKLGVEKKEAADYILRLHRGNGSFVPDASSPLDNPANGKVKYACMAVSALKLLGRDEKDVLTKAKRFSLRMRHLEGGFGSSDGMFSDATLENTYYAVKALEKLDSLYMVGGRPSGYVLGLQNADGGFSPYRAGEVSFTSGRRNWRSDIESTFYAISTLDTLGALDAEVRKRSENYVMSLKNEDGSFCHSRSEPGPLGEPPGTGAPLSTAYAVLCLGIIVGEEKT